MKLLVVALVTLAGSACAEPLTISIGEAQVALAALNTLSKGKVVLIKEGATEKTVTLPYKGWPLSVMLAMSKDIAELKKVVTPYEESMQKIMQSAADDEGKIPVVEQRRIIEDDKAERKKPLTVDIEKFSLADLKPEANDITNPSLFNDLAPLLK